MKNTNKINYTENKEIIKKINSRFRTFNREMAHHLGLKVAVYLAYLIDQDKFHNDTKLGDEFYKQIKYITIETTLSIDDVKKANKILKNLEVLIITKKGNPCRNFFRINYKKLLEVYETAFDKFTKMIEEQKLDKTQFYKAKKLSKKDENVEEKNDTKNEKIDEKNLKNNVEISRKIDTSVSEKFAHLVSEKLAHYIYKTKQIKKRTKYINFINKISGHDVTLTPKTMKLINIKDLRKREGEDRMIDNEFFSEKEKEKEKKPTKKEKEKVKGGLKPLLAITNEKFEEGLYDELKGLLFQYIRCHLGKRRLPTEEKWAGMLDNLKAYSSLTITNAVGTKFLQSRAIKIVERAIQGKGDGIPFLDFDNIF